MAGDEPETGGGRPGFLGVTVGHDQGACSTNGGGLVLVNEDFLGRIRESIPGESHGDGVRGQCFLAPLSGFDLGSRTPERASAGVLRPVVEVTAVRGA